MQIVLMIGVEVEVVVLVEAVAGLGECDRDVHLLRLSMLLGPPFHMRLDRGSKNRDRSTPFLFLLCSDATSMLA